MLEKFIYENHLGQRFDGLANGVYLNSNDLRDYSWSYDIINNRISRFYRSVKPRKLPLVFCGKTEEQSTAARNRLTDIAEADILSVVPGKIWIGDYYTSGFITDSTKSEYLIDRRYTKNDLVFTSANPAWFRDRTHVFSLNDNEGAVVGYGIDYPFDYPYDYAGTSNKTRQIVCDTVTSSKIKIRIYGEATNPTINIAGHAYTINGMIKQGETLLIDGVNKTITLTTATGTKVNWFDKRNRESYIFEPIPPGLNDVRYDGTFGFDLTVVEERSEPKWT